MIPVYDEVIEKIDLNTIPADKSDQDYRNLLMKDFLFCSENKESILKKTKKAYKIYEDKKPYMEELIKACCNFPLLVDGMKKYRKVQLNTSTTKPKAPTNVAIDEQNNTFEEVAVTKVL